MPDQELLLYTTDFSGGLNTVTTPFLLKPNELKTADNVVFDVNGSLVKRNGSTKKNSTNLNLITTSSANTTFTSTRVTDGSAWDLSLAKVGMIALASGGSKGTITVVNDGSDYVDVGSWDSGTPSNGETVQILNGQSKPVHSIFRYYKSATAFKRLVAVHNDYMWEIDDSTGVATFVGDVSTDDPGTFLVWKDVMYYANGTVFKTWDGTTFANVSGSPKMGKYITLHKDRIWIAGISAEPNALYYCDYNNATSWTVGSNYILLDEDDGDKISGLLSMGSALMIYKTTSIWQLSTNITDLSNYYLSNISKTVGLNASKTLISYLGSHYFLDKTDFYNLGPNGLVSLSGKINDIIDGIPYDSLEDASAVVYKRQIFITYTPEGQSGNNAILNYDMRLGVWSKFTGITAFSMVNYDGQDDQGEVFAGSSADGFVYEVMDGVSDDGSDIEVTIESKSFDMGNPVLRKVIHEFLLFVSQANTVNVNMTGIMNEGEVENTNTFNVVSSAAVYDTAEFDVDVFADGASNKILRGRKNVNMGSGGTLTGEMLSFKVVETSQVIWTLYAIGCIYSLEGLGCKIMT